MGNMGLYIYKENTDVFAIIPFYRASQSEIKALFSIILEA
jgi:hypothetical protein